MPAPTLVAEGTLSVVTTSAGFSVTLPTNQADDIVIVAHASWAPNTTANPGFGSVSSPWARVDGTLLQTGSPQDGETVLFWTRITTPLSSMTVSPANWDTGTDTCKTARAYVIRGCETTGNPWDAVAVSSLIATANGTMPAVTVSGTERLVIQFLLAHDDNGVGTTPSGWTAGTRVSTTTGTDGEHQTFRKDNVSASTSAQASGVLARTAGFYSFCGISFKPPTPVAPSAITTLADTELDSRVILRWTAPANGGSPITSYDYRVNGGSWVSTGSTNTIFTVTGLTNNTAYNFEVRAVNAIGAAATSNVVSGTPKTYPAALQNVNWAQFAWAGDPFATQTDGVVVSSHPDRSGYGRDFANSGTKRPLFELTGSGSNSKPTFIFDGVDDNLQGVYWNAEPKPVTIVGITYLDPTAVAANTGSLAACYAFGVRHGTAGGVTVFTWNQSNVEIVPQSTFDPKGKLALYVFVNNGASSKWRVNNLSGSISLTSSVVDNMTGQFGSWDGNANAALLKGEQAVLGVFPGDFTTDSNYNSFLTWAESEYNLTILRPSAITDLAAAPGTGQVTLTWTAPASNGSGISDYEYRVNGGSWVSTGSTAASKVVTGLTPGVSHSFEVRAINSFGTALISNTANATPTGGTNAIGFVGTSMTQKMYAGSNLVNKVYHGSTQIWP
jgi:titin